MPEDFFYNVLLATLDEGDDLHPGSAFGTFQRVGFKNSLYEGGPTRRGAARLAVHGRSCLTDKPSVDRHVVPRRLSGADATATIRVPTKITDQMLALVGDVLR